MGGRANRMLLRFDAVRSLRTIAILLQKT